MLEKNFFFRKEFSFYVLKISKACRELLKIFYRPFFAEIHFQKKIVKVIMVIFKMALKVLKKF